MTHARYPDEALTIFWDNQHQAGVLCISLGNSFSNAQSRHPTAQTKPSRPDETGQCG